MNEKLTEYYGFYGSYRATDQAVQYIVITTGSNTLALGQTPFSCARQAVYSNLGLNSFINYFRPMHN